MVEKWNLEKIQHVKGGNNTRPYPPWTARTRIVICRTFWQHAWEELSQGRSAECEAEDKLINRYLHFQVRTILPQKYAKDEEISSHAVVIVNDVTEKKRAERETGSP